MSVLPRARHPNRWLWPDLPEAGDLVDAAPSLFKLKPARREWARERLDEMEALRLSALQAALDANGQLRAEFRDGELRLLVGGIPVCQRIFLDQNYGPVVQAYWRFLFLSQACTDAAAFASKLRQPPSDVRFEAARQFIERVNALASECGAIAAAEREMNERLFDLYRLSPDERLLVETSAQRSRLRIS